MLAGLPVEARRRLEAAATLRVVAGRILAAAGGRPARVRRTSCGSGRLEVDVGGQLVRELGPGDVLGELALLTGERTVRGRPGTPGLDGPRGARGPPSTDLLDTDPAAARVVLTQVAERLRTAGGATRPGRRPAQPTVVAVVGLHPGSGSDEVADVLLHPASPAPARSSRRA